MVRRGEGRGGHGAKRLIGGAAVCTSWCDLVAGSQGRRAECTAETRMMQLAASWGRFCACETAETKQKLLNRELGTSAFGLSGC